MHLKKYLLLVFFTLFAQNVIFGQSKGKMTILDWSAINPATGQAQDFIVLSSGQFVYGEVVRNYNLADYEEVNFKSGGQSSVYVPSAIQGFGLSNGQVFLSKPLPERDEPVFLQVLFSGPIQLGGYKGAYFLDNGIKYQELKPRYENIDKEGPAYRKYMRPFIGTIKQYLSGDCGVLLFPVIDKAPFNDQAMIRLLSTYFDCEGLSYRVHIEDVPFIQVSPLIGFGLSNFNIKASSRVEGRVDQLESNSGFQAFAGVRFHDSRKLPRASADFRIAVSSFQTQVFSSYDGGQFLRTGSETIRETALFIPISLNYSVIKRPRTELYLGIFAALWIANVTGEEGRVDNRILEQREVFIYESPITVYQGTSYTSGARIGTSYVFSERLKLFAEIEGSIQNDYYQFALLQNQAYYDRSRLTFQVGIEF